MSGHSNHQAWPGYATDQLLIDGCQECSSRSGSLREFLPHADAQTWQQAWRRAVEYGTEGLTDASATELTILRELWQVAVAFQTQAPPEALLNFAYQGLWLTGDAVEDAGMGER